MERYLREYIREVAEGMDIKLTQTQMKAVVNKLECDDYIWEVLDSHIADAIEEVI